MIARTNDICIMEGAALEGLARRVIFQHALERDDSCSDSLEIKSIRDVQLHTNGPGSQNTHTNTKDGDEERDETREDRKH